MNAKKFRNLAFTFHCYLGLLLGLLLIFIGLTGSLLIFEREIENIIIARQLGSVIPQEQTISIDRLISSFFPLHNGAFGGLPTRILYVFVGLSPTVLFITGLTMYRLRRRPKIVKQTSKELIER